MGPPQMSSNIQKKHKFRFVATSAFSGVITSSQAFGASGTIGTVTNTTVTNKNESLRVVSIEMWTPPASQGAAATCSVEWIGSNQSPTREISDTSISVTKPAHVFSRPPVDALCAFWQTANNSFNLFNIVCPAGTIIDLNLALIECDGEQATTFAVATAVLGTAYYLALDHGTSDKLVPVSLNTTV